MQKEQEQAESQQLLAKHINSIRKVNKKQQIYYQLSLVPSATQIDVLKNIGKKQQIQDDSMKDSYYCKEQRCGEFLKCLPYEQISLNCIYQQVQSIFERLLKASTLLFFLSVIPFLYVVIGASFFQFIVILIGRFFIQHSLQPKKNVCKSKMRMAFMSQIVISLILICIMGAFVYDEILWEDQNTLFRLISIIPFQIWMLFYQIYWMRYYESYLLEISQYPEEEILELHKNKLILDLFLLQKYFNYHFNQFQKFYLFKQNPGCRFYEESIKFAIENPDKCQQFYNQQINLKKEGGDVENQNSNKLMHSENYVHKLMVNAVLNQIKDELASSEELNQQELVSVIETFKNKKSSENQTAILPHYTHRTSAASYFPQTPTCHSPQLTTNRNINYFDTQLQLYNQNNLEAQLSSNPIKQDNQFIKQTSNLAKDSPK